MKWGCLIEDNNGGLRDKGDDIRMMAVHYFANLFSTSGLSKEDIESIVSKITRKLTPEMMTDLDKLFIPT